MCDEIICWRHKTLGHRETLLSVYWREKREASERAMNDECFAGGTGLTLEDQSFGGYAKDRNKSQKARNIGGIRSCKASCAA